MGFKKSVKNFLKKAKYLRPSNILKPLIEPQIKKKIAKQLNKALEESKITLGQQKAKDKQAARELIDKKIQAWNDDIIDLEHQLAENNITSEQLNDIRMWVMLALLDCKNGTTEYLLELLDVQDDDVTNAAYSTKSIVLEFLFNSPICPLQHAYESLNQHHRLEALEFILPFYCDPDLNLSEENKTYYSKLKSIVVNRIGEPLSQAEGTYSEYEYMLMGLHQLVDDHFYKWNGQCNFEIMSGEPNHIDSEKISHGQLVVYQKRANDWYLHYPVDLPSYPVFLHAPKTFPSVTGLASCIHLYRSGSSPAIYALVVHPEFADHDEVLNLTELGIAVDDISWPEQGNLAYQADPVLIRQLMKACKRQYFAHQSTQLVLSAEHENSLLALLGEKNRSRVLQMPAHLAEIAMQLMSQSVPMLNSVTQASSPVGMMLAYGDSLSPGQYLTDSYGLFSFIVERDGRGIVYERLPNNAARMLFCSPALTANKGYKFSITSDGNIEIACDEAKWTSQWNSPVCKPDFCAMQGDGHLVVYGTLNQQQTPLYRSGINYPHIHGMAKEGNGLLEKILDLLTVEGRCLEYVDFKGHLPLDYALAWGHIETAQLMMTHGAKLGRLPVHRSRHVAHLADDVICILVNNHTMVGFNLKNNTWVNVVSTAEHDRRIRNYASDYGADKHTHTPLVVQDIYVNEQQFAEIRQYIAREENDVDILLSDAARAGQAEACHLFILLGGNVNTRKAVDAQPDNTDALNSNRDEGRTPLMWAITGQNHPATVTLLLKAGADCRIKTRDNRQMTAWHFAFEAFKRFATSNSAIEIIQIMSAFDDAGISVLNGENKLPHQMVEFNAVTMPMRLALSGTLRDLNHDKCFQLPFEHFNTNSTALDETETTAPRWWPTLLNYLHIQRSIEPAQLCKHVGGCMLYFMAELPAELGPYWGDYIVIAKNEQLFFISGIKEQEVAEPVLVGDFKKLLEEAREKQIPAIKDNLALTYDQHQSLFSGRNNHPRSAQNGSTLLRDFNRIYGLIPAFNPGSKAVLGTQRLEGLLDDLTVGYTGCSTGYQSRVRVGIERACGTLIRNFQELFFASRKDFAEKVYQSSAISLKSYAHRPTDEIFDIHDMGLFWSFCAVGLNLPGTVSGEYKLIDSFFYKSNVAKLLLDNLHDQFRPYSLVASLTTFFKSTFDYYVGYRNDLPYNPRGEDDFLDQYFTAKFKWLFPDMRPGDNRVLDHIFGTDRGEEIDNSNRIYVIDKEPYEVRDINWPYVERLMFDCLRRQGYFDISRRSFVEINYANTKFVARHVDDAVDYYENGHVLPDDYEVFIVCCGKAFANQAELLGKLLLASIKKGDIQLRELVIAKGADINFAQPFNKASAQEVKSYVNFLERIEYAIEHKIVPPMPAPPAQPAAPAVDLYECVAKVNLQWFDERTPLMMAIAQGDIPFILMLLDDLGASIDFQNSQGWTALHEAAFLSRKLPELAMDIIEILFLRGANTMLRAQADGMPADLLTILPVQLPWPHTEAYQYLSANTDVNVTAPVPIVRAEPIDPHSTVDVKEITIPFEDSILPYLVLAGRLIEDKINFPRAIQQARAAHAALISLPKAFYNRQICDERPVGIDGRKPGLYFYREKETKKVSVLIVHDRSRFEIHESDNIAPSLKLESINAAKSTPKRSLPTKTSQNSWATGEGIYRALSHYLGDAAHIISPNLSSVSTPLSNKEGIKAYVEQINGYINSAGEVIPNGFIQSDGGILQKPIVMVINTRSVRAASRADANASGGTHWVTCIVLPKNYKILDRTFSHSAERIFFIDSMQKNPLPTAFIAALTEGIVHDGQREPSEAELADNPDLTPTSTIAFVHLLPAAFPEAQIIHVNQFVQQSDGSDCGWWSVYNSMMMVLTGSQNYMQRFAPPSKPERAAALRDLLPGLDQDSGFRPNENISNLELLSNRLLDLFVSPPIPVTEPETETKVDPLLADDNIAIAILSNCQYPYSMPLNMNGRLATSLLQLLNSTLALFSRRSIFYSDVPIADRLSSDEFQESFQLAAAHIDGIPGIPERWKVAVLTTLQVMSRNAFDAGDFSAPEQLAGFYREAVSYIGREFSESVVHAVLEKQLESNRNHIALLKQISESVDVQIDAQYQATYSQIRTALQEQFKEQEKKAIKKACKNIDIAICVTGIVAAFAPMLSQAIVASMAEGAAAGTTAAAAGASAAGTAAASSISLSAIAIDALSKALVGFAAQSALTGDAKHSAKGIVKDFALNFIPAAAAQKAVTTLKLNTENIWSLKSALKESLRAVFEHDRHILPSTIVGGFAGALNDRLAASIRPELNKLFNNKLIEDAFENVIVSSLSNVSINVARRRKLSLQDALSAALTEAFQTFLGECLAKNIVVVVDTLNEEQKPEQMDEEMQWRGVFAEEALTDEFSFDENCDNEPKKDNLPDQPKTPVVDSIDRISTTSDGDDLEGFRDLLNPETPPVFPHQIDIITEYLRGFCNGVSNSFISWIEAIAHPIDHIVEPLTLFAYDCAIITAGASDQTTSVTDDPFMADLAIFQALLKRRPELYAESKHRMEERKKDFLSYKEKFVNGSGPVRTEMLAELVTSIFTPGAIVKGARAAVNLKRFGVTNPVMFEPNKLRGKHGEWDLAEEAKHFESIVIEKLQMSDIRKMHNEYLIYVIDENNQLLIAQHRLPRPHVLEKPFTFNFFDTWKTQYVVEYIGHRDLASFRPVYAAGELRIVNGLVDSINDLSGCFKPFHQSLSHQVETSFIKNGYSEARGKFTLEGDPEFRPNNIKKPSNGLFWTYAPASFAGAAQSVRREEKVNLDFGGRESRYTRN